MLLCDRPSFAFHYQRSKTILREFPRSRYMYRATQGYVREEKDVCIVQHWSCLVYKYGPHPLPQFFPANPNRNEYSQTKKKSERRTTSFLYKSHLCGTFSTSWNTPSNKCRNCGASRNCTKRWSSALLYGYRSMGPLDTNRCPFSDTRTERWSGSAPFLYRCGISRSLCSSWCSSFGKQ